MISLSNFTEYMFPRVKLTINQHRFECANRRLSISRTYHSLLYWHINASLCLDQSVEEKGRLKIGKLRACVWHVQMNRYSFVLRHYADVIMGTMASQTTSLTIVYSTVYSDADQRKYQSSASLAFVRGIHRRPVNSPHKWPVTRKMFPFDDVIMSCSSITNISLSGLVEQQRPHLLAGIR